ncbi:MAG TPA: VTT domain-containing protein [Ardenticatenaceae bacterium]|nr:VTT domain-containing protein [Ardenticatenaceae bacterium]
MGHGLTEQIVAYGPTVAYILLFAVIFAESGLFFGFFLPGDSLLLTVGLLASQGVLNIGILIPLLFIAAVLGDNVGYWFGKKTGPRIFNRDNSLLFRRNNLLKAREFYDRHGGKTIVLARFMPFIRTFAPIVAGAVEMDYRRFMLFNLIGGVLWAIGVTLAGFIFGRILPTDVIERYFLIVIALVVVISALPAMIHVWQESRHEILAYVRNFLGRPRRTPPSVDTE